MSSISVSNLNRKQRSLVARELGISPKQLQLRGTITEPSSKSERFNFRRLAERVDGSRTRR